MLLKLIYKYRQLLIYGLSLGVLFIILRWLEWQFIFQQQAFKIYGGIIAILFTALGIWIATKLISPKVQTIILEKEASFDSPFEVNQAEIDRLRLSKREMEVLQLMADGLTNPQIAEKLFVSLNTIKTHSSNLFLKLEVTRRTEAIKNARKLRLIP
ncbi:response regulator transcription factor [Mucilaginibacter sp. KACC 22063]|uniref:response regulator transcription factor n=1 Tax=Mucilaginibacter sp. KACC 22063 TaxID=3025666 RepID=UPI0023660773|nr:response regulator transcription factor [Mucilaginibacter sp. KACC 22063]WDF55740.1 response regulator transcription factor [Mucilaginibacter sp. KACC 22063]